MKLIYKTTANSTLNEKAKTFAKFVRMYENCLLQRQEDYDELVEGIRGLLNRLNKEYPRTKPFEVYMISDSYIVITPVGKPETIIAHLLLSDVRNVLDTEEGLVPIEDYELIKSGLL